MSILINGAKMPKTCNECQSTLGLFCNECPLFKDFPKEFTGESELLEHTRLSDCPLVEIPPHGRLIDVDKLKDKLSGKMETDRDLFVFLVITDHMPTVIESEEEDER